MAKILRKKKKSIKVEMNEELPFFEVLYMGRMETEARLDRDCVRVIVQHLVDKTRNEPLKPVRITITTRGLWVQEGPQFNPPGRETFIPIHNISYGAADQKYTKVFTFVTNFQEGGDAQRKGSTPFYSYVFRCETQAMARGMVVYLLRAFKAAYITWQKDIKRIEFQKKLTDGPAGLREVDRASSDSNARSEDGSDQHTVDSGCSTEDELESDSDTSKMVTLSNYLERWVRQQGPKRMNKATDTDELNYILSKEERDASFRIRADKYSRPDLLNCDVDLQKEMSDPDVQNVFHRMMKINVTK